MKKTLMVLIVLLILVILYFLLLFNNINYSLENSIFTIIGITLIILGLFIIVKSKNKKLTSIGYFLITVGIILLGIKIINIRKEEYVDKGKITYSLEENITFNNSEKENICEKEVFDEQTDLTISEIIHNDSEILSEKVVINTEEDNQISTVISNKLLTLKSSIGDFDKKFNPDINEYILTLPEKTKEIILEGNSYDNTMITGLGKIEITDTIMNIEISVLANESNESNIYKITIIKKVSTNTELSNLIPSSGIIEYSNDILEYELKVEDNVSEISFDAIPIDSDITITGNSLTPLNYGQNEIIITVTAEDKVTTRKIKITVTRQKEIKSSVYQITREGEIPYIIGSNPKTKISDFISNFDCDFGILHIYDKDDTEITDLNIYVGSYMKLKLIVNGLIHDELVIVVQGDLNGDGLVTSTDRVSVNNLILGKKESTYISNKIADVTHDGLITESDLIKIKNYILGKIKTFTKND